jgi:hypothetical protein
MRFLILFIAVALNLTAAPYRILPVTFIKSNDIPPRLQWNHNAGYCGEVSLISAGLYYGQYISQYDARSDLDIHIPYNLYKYSSVDKIPTSHFNAQAANASETWQIQVETGTTYTMQVSIMSDETAAFRCVRATAP